MTKKGQLCLLCCLAWLFSCYAHSGKGNTAGIHAAKKSSKTVNIIGEETWSGEIELQTTVRVMPNASLTIEPGSTIVFIQDKKQELGIIVEPKGQIISKGTSAKPILFTVKSRQKSRKNWGGIRFTRSKESVFFFTHFLYAEQGIRSVDTDVMVYQSLFRFSKSACYFDGGNVRVLSSFFDNNITAMSFKNSGPKIVKNTFSNNKRALFFMEKSFSAIVHENNFFKNKTNIEINTSEKYTINLVQNFWGTRELSQIKKTIHYRNRLYSGRETVRLSPFAFTPFKPIENKPFHSYYK